MDLVIQCSSCDQAYTLDVTNDQLQRWSKGELAQNVFTNLTAAERELLITQTCGECFNKLFDENA